MLCASFFLNFLTEVVWFGLLAEVHISWKALNCSWICYCSCQ